LQNADTKRQAESLQQSAGQVENEKERMRAEIEELRRQLRGLELSGEESARKQKELEERLLG